MRFAFSTFNHCLQGKIIVEDITVTMGSQIAALGHKVTWTEDADFIPREEGWNVVLECFADDATIVGIPIVETLAKAHAAGCRFLCVATEEPGEVGFNSALDPGMILRQNAFPAAAQYLDGILHLVPGDNVTRWYSNFAPSAYAELGFAPAMVEESREEPHIDFGFYGLMTWRRREIIDEIAKRSGKPVLEMTSLLTPRAQRNDEMRRARVILQIRANLETQWVSSTRCASALHMGRPIVAEPHQIRGPWDEIVPFADTIEDFYVQAIATAANWRGAWRGQVDRFAAKLSPGTCVGRPLKEIGAI